jgi:hypothetical protein
MLHTSKLENRIFGKNLSQMTTHFSFYTILKASNQEMSPILRLYTNLSWNDQNKSSSSRTESTLCGAYLPLRSFRPSFTVVRLCTETPTAGGRVFEAGDEKLLQLVHKLGAQSALSTSPFIDFCDPLMIVN